MKELAATSNGWKIITKSSMPGYRSKNNEKKNKKKLKQKPENKLSIERKQKDKQTNKNKTTTHLKPR